MGDADKLNIDNIIARLLEGKRYGVRVVNERMTSIPFSIPISCRFITFTNTTTNATIIWEVGNGGICLSCLKLIA